MEDWTRPCMPTPPRITSGGKNGSARPSTSDRRKRPTHWGAA